MVYELGYHTLGLKGRGSTRSLGYHALRWMCVRGGTDFQKSGKSPVFLDPDPADLREGCRFRAPPAIQTTRPGDAKKPLWASPPRAVNQHVTVTSISQLVTVTSKKQNCNTGNYNLRLVQETANHGPTAWWPHKGAGDFSSKIPPCRGTGPT